MIRFVLEYFNFVSLFSLSSRKCRLQYNRLSDFYSGKIFQAITGRQFIQTGLAFSLGLLPYTQLPLSAYFSNSPCTWGNHKTLSGLFCARDVVFLCNCVVITGYMCQTLSANMFKVYFYLT